MCPASRPAPPKPVYSLPPPTMPLPIPVPRVTTTAGSQPRAEPAQYSPDGRAVSVVAQIEGQFQLPLEQSPERVFRKGILGVLTTTPSRLSTRPGSPAPAA